jgi:outer membrane protein assembly factor BamB
MLASGILITVSPVVWILGPLILCALLVLRRRALWVVAGLDVALFALQQSSRSIAPDSWTSNRFVLAGAVALTTLLGALWVYQHRLTRGNGVRISEMLLLVVLFFATSGPGLLSPPPVRQAEAVELAWTFEPPERGAIISSPLIFRDRVYVAAIEDAALWSRGAIYCRERATGGKVWKFTDDGTMQHMYSSPCLADGRLFIGEGMHANYVCKLYCTDADSGKKLWHFETAGHIESSPCVADGKVFFGAGDDGVYCLDAATGQVRWHFHGPFHIDSSPAVLGHRIFIGSGLSRAHHNFALFCLDTERGDEVWRVPTDLPVWGSPVVDGEQVFFGLGNGRLLQSAEPPIQPAGAVLCVAGETGQRLWRYDTADGLLARTAVDVEHVYFGARDGYCYCLDRHDGRLRWKANLGSPIVTAPTLLQGCLYVVATDGLVSCREAATGKEFWSFDVARHSGTSPRLVSSPAVIDDLVGGSTHRLIYFGAELRNATSSAAMLYCLRD